MKKLTKAVLAFAAAGALALTGCTTGRDAAPAPGSGASPGASGAAAGGFAKDALIGVALPQKTSENWVLAEQLFKDGLTQAGFKADVQFANNGPSEQQNVISSMVTKGAKVIIVGAVDGSQLGPQVKAAKDSGATVIAYDRLLTGTKDVDYYVAFDNFKVGVLQGQALMKGLSEKKGGGPYNVELIAGSPDDSNAKVFFNGAMSILQPEIDKGTLKVLSGQKTFEQAVTQGWKSENAQKRMDTILSANYSGATKLDGILSPNDTLARAALQSVKAAGKTGDNLPVVTGQDSEVESIKLVKSGEQYSTIYKDTRKLVAQAVKMVQSLQTGAKPEVNDEKQYDNGVKVVPSYLIPPVIVTKDNADATYKDDPLLGKVVNG